MPSYRRKSSKGRLYKKRTYKRKSYAKKASPIKKMIKREIARNVENKSKTSFLAAKILFSSASASFPNNIFPVCPNSATLDILQGTNQGSRIGNVIKTKKLIFKGTMIPEDYNVSTWANPRPVQARMVFFYDKTMPTNTPSSLTDFFQNGSSTTGPSGYLPDMWMPINTDRYAVLKNKIIKIGMAQYAGTAASVTNQGDWQAYSNNDFKLNAQFSIDLTKHYPKIVKFNDNNAQPTTRSLQCAILLASADGALLNSTTSSTPCSMQFVIDYHYEDA